MIAGGTTPTEGKSGEALRFARRDDFVECADAESLKPVNEFTLAAWFLADNWHGAVHDGSIISKEDWKRGTSNGYVLRGGKRAVDMTIGLHGWKTCVSEPSLATGQWHHAVGTFDGKELRLYVNGQAQTPRPAEGTIAVSNYPLKIGASAFAKERHFMGAIDEVAIWNRALTADEAVSLYEFSKNGKSYCAGIGRAAR